MHDHRVGVPKIVLGDFNEWMKGLATQTLSERLQSIDLRTHLRRRRTYPGVFPVLHLDHIYYEGQVDVVKLELPRTRLSLMASDHLPLVAELKVKFSELKAAKTVRTDTGVTFGTWHGSPIRRRMLVSGERCEPAQG